MQWGLVLWKKEYIIIIPVEEPLFFCSLECQDTSSGLCWTGSTCRGRAVWARGKEQSPRSWPAWASLWIFWHLYILLHLLQRCRHTDHHYHSYPYGTLLCWYSCCSESLLLLLLRQSRILQPEHHLPVSRWHFWQDFMDEGEKHRGKGRFYYYFFLNHYLDLKGTAKLHLNLFICWNTFGETPTFL